MIEIKMPDTSIIELVKRGDIYKISPYHPSTKYIDVKYMYQQMKDFDTVEVVDIEKINSPIKHHHSLVLLFKNENEEVKTSVFSFTEFSKFLEESVKLDLDYGKENNVFRNYGQLF